MGNSPLARPVHPEAFYSPKLRGGAEEAVRDRLSFPCFCGLSLDRQTPDHASIWRFRQTIDELGLSAALLAGTNRHSTRWG
jgi:IS5 family transposase